MNISSTASAFVPLLKQHKLISKRESDDKYKLIMLSLFKDLLEAEKYIENKCQVAKTVYTSTEHNIEDHIHLSKNTRFFPKAIRKYIQDTPCSLIKYTCEIEGRENNVYFYSYANEVGANGMVGANEVGANEMDTNEMDTNEMGTNLTLPVKLMFMWLYICIKNAKQTCAKELNVYIFLTPFKKTLPPKKTSILSAEHVNTAFTYCCLPEGEITIFRAEEWFKVFIHESFHAYNLDFGLTAVPASLQDQLKSLFHIKSEFNINEAYSETWARIMNGVLYSFASLTEREKSFDTFFMYTDFCLQLERLFSLYQLNKILDFMGLNYTDITSAQVYLKAHLYKEDTHVFGYYILTALFLNDYKEFMQWCAATNNNNSIMKFNCQAESFQKMGTYIQQIHHKDDVLRMLSLLQSKKIKTTAAVLRTTRMSIIDLVDIPK
jgi:hypothetical protein